MLCLWTTGLLDPAQAATGLSEQQVGQVVADVRPTLEALTYDDVASKIAPTRFTGSQITNKQLEIFKATGRPINSITREEAIAALQKDYAAEAGYAGTFNLVKDQLEVYLTQLIDSDSAASGRDAAYYTQTIKDKAAQLLLGLTYEQRLYDFDYKQTNFARGLRTSGTFGKAFNPLDVAISLGSQNGDQFAMPKNIDTFNRLLAGTVTDARDLDGFIKTVVPAGEVDDWYTGQLTEHGNVVSENSSPSIPDGQFRLYSKLTSSQKLSPYFLPLVTRTNGSMYVLSNVSSVSFGMREGYVADKNDAGAMAFFKEKVAQYGADQANYIEFWARMVPGKKDSFKTDRIATDGFFVAGRGSGAQGWSPKSGANAAQAVTEFFGPMNRWTAYKFIGAEATGPDITFWASRILEPSGASAYTHELTHQLAQNAPYPYLNGNARRTGTSTELFPRGLYETYEYNHPVYQLNQIMSWPASGYANSSVTPFKDEASVQNYMKNLLDVTNTLDLIEAEDVLARDAATKQKWFNTVSLTPSANFAGKFDETFAPSSAAEAAKWSSVDDLVDANAVVARYEAVGTQTTGVAPYNAYPTVPLFSPLYGAPQAANGSTGDIHMRRIAWELLGDKGFTGGWVPYLSDQYRPAGVADGEAFADAVVMKHLGYDSGAAFRKAMYAKRQARLGELNPVEIEFGGKKVKVDGVAKLRELMKQAVDADLADQRTGVRATDTAVERLKSAVYLAYKASTGEFANSIYGAAPKHRVTYKFAGEVPADAQAPSSDVQYAAGDTVKLAEVAPAATLEKDGVDGTWAFDGWKAAGAGDVVTEVTMADADIELVGTWTFTPNKYKVTYRVDGEAPAGAPEAPRDEAEYTTGQEVTVKPALTTTATEKDGVPGTWTFSGWLNNGAPAEKVTVNKADVALVGSWAFAPKGQHAVTFVYAVDDGGTGGTGNDGAGGTGTGDGGTGDGSTGDSGTGAGPNLPATLRAPAPESGYEGSEVTLPAAPADFRDDAAHGTWHFVGWDPEKVTIGADDVTVTGKWKFTPDPVSFDALKAALADARKAMEGVAVSADGKDVEPANKWVTQSDVDALNGLIAQVEGEIAKPANLKQDDVDALEGIVKKAAAHFVEVQQPGMKKDAESQGKPETDSQQQPSKDPDQQVTSDPDKGRQPDTSPGVDSKPDTKPDTNPEVHPDPEHKPDTDSQNKPDARPDAESQGKPETDSQGKPETDSQGKPETDSQGKPETGPDADSQGKPETDSQQQPGKDPDQQATPDSKPEHNPDTEPAPQTGASSAPKPGSDSAPVPNPIVSAQPIRGGKPAAGELPYTGAEVLSVAALSAMLLTLGGAVVVALRRRDI